MLKEYLVSGTTLSDINTEVRFDVAAARADKTDIIRFKLPKSDDDKNNKRLLFCFIKVLRSMQKTGLIQFYVKDEDLEAMTTGALFLKNRFGDDIIPSPDDYTYVYVKQ